MNVHKLLVDQFHRPNGVLGRLAGWIMSTRDSNLSRNRWAVEQLDVRPGHRVLELGPGPGVTLGNLLESAHPGSVTAVDHSPLMADACRKRHREAIREGRLHVIESTFPGVPTNVTFDRILAVNSLQFDAETQDMFSCLAKLLGPSGKLVVVFQPRSANASFATAESWADRTATLMTGAGFDNVATKCLPLEPVPAMAVIGSMNE